MNKKGFLTGGTAMSKRVVVVGGGWGGVSAAVSAKNAGADVVVLERTDMLLGTGLVGGIMHNNGRYTATQEMIAMGCSEVFATIGKNCRHQCRVPRAQTCQPI
jgi:NADPH-dependent 2,4-dienoyl-CoA reductase/sulfur reductase-like enzyme